MTQLLQRSGVALCALALAACISAGSDSGRSTEPRRVSVSLIGYGSSPFRIVSESHTRRVDLYSSVSASPSTKVQTDDVVVALVEHLEELGFESYSHRGKAPDQVTHAFTHGFEVLDEGASAWWPLTAAAGPTELKNFNTAVRDFLDLYNLTASYQRVDNEVGSDYFQRKRPGAR
jgi:hypothetical protein